MRTNRSRFRFTLVVGNSAYEEVDVLPNPVADAEAVGAALSRLGFDVTLALNLSKNEFVSRLADFSDLVSGAEIAIVYCAEQGANSFQVHQLGTHLTGVSRSRDLFDGRILRSFVGVFVIPLLKAGLSQRLRRGTNAAKSTARIEISSFCDVVS
ncbi:caspase family protein [Roseibium aggregatum]|uniref:caspase family protein n=1 Tax=Roseibium aggregatum TaxID=187304 RepID=UPI001A8C5DB2|nr:caspase family protein [Roseibium aggregatum]MBN8185035.1 caspase family protein [Roseibium aggregatum]